MTTVLIIQCLTMVALFLFSAFFSSSETALFSLNPIQLHHLRKTRPAAADRIQRILAIPTHLLSTILIGNTLVNVTLAGIGYLIAERLAPRWGEAISIPAMTVLLLLFGEVTPKRHAMAHAEGLAAVYAYILPPLIRLFTPLRWIVERTAALFRKDLRAPSRVLTEDEFLSVVQVGQEKGVLNPEERTMVDGIISLEDKQASEVMTPRVDLIGIDLDDPPQKWLETACRVQFRQVPIYRGSLDHPEGFLDVPKYLLSPGHDFEGSRLEPFFVPETAPLDALLTTFQKEHRRAVFVMDEYGGTAGLVTLGDLLEEIVGDVESELAVEKLTIQKMSENRWIVDGGVSLDDLSYQLGMHLASEGADRIAGWINEQMGRIAHTGDVVEAQGCRATVHRTRRTRIVTVLLEKVEDRAAAEGDWIQPADGGEPEVVPPL
jgi:putative hemolysin